MLADDLRQLFENAPPDGSVAIYQRALDLVADEFDARTATLHRADSEKRTLHLLASRGIPDKLLPITQTIPFGKGMAGICAERRDFVTVCNLQTDESGVARPAAKETGVEGAIVTPILRTGRDLAGTLGVGKAGEHDYTEVERATLAACAAVFAEKFATG